MKVRKNKMYLFKSDIDNLTFIGKVVGKSKDGLTVTIEHENESYMLPKNYILREATKVDYILYPGMEVIFEA